MSFKFGILPVTLLQQNCALVWDDETNIGAVIDPGGDVSTIIATVEKMNLTIKDIFLTHGHFDHAGGATELADALKIPVTGPGIEDKFLLDHLVEDGLRYGVSGKNCHPTRWLAHGETIKMGGVAFNVRHCPGHTPGHMVFLSPALKFGFMGDVLFKGSIGRTDLGNYGDYDQLITSIRRELLCLPDDFAFSCGHGPGSTIGSERLTNPFLQGSHTQPA